MFQKKMYEKKGEKKTRVSDVVSSLAWNCHEFVAQISASPSFFKWVLFASSFSLCFLCRFD